MIAQTANRLTARAKGLLVALVVALLLAAGASVAVAAQPAEAYEYGVCKHSTSIHRGPEGRYHGVTFEDSYWSSASGRRLHYHRMAHYTKRNGSWDFDWYRRFVCGHTVSA